MRRVRAKRLAALALGALALGGATVTPALAGKPIEDRQASALAPVHARVRAHSAASHGPSVSAALAALLKSAAIDEAVYHHDYAAYVAAKSSLGRLSGTRKQELGAVIA